MSEGILAPVVHVLRRSDQLSRVPETFQHYPSSVVARSMRTMQDLAVVGQTLDRGGVAWVTLKGPVLSNLVYATPGVRDSVDLDLLVAPSETRRSIELLVGSGAHVMGVDWSSAAWRSGAECPMLLRHGTELDLHWHTINRPEVRHRYEAPIEPMLTRRTTRTLHGSSISTPDDLDFVLHVLLHACLDGCARLRSVLDAQQCVLWLARTGHEPRDLAQRAHGLGVEAAAWVALETTARVLDPRVRAWALALEGRTWWARCSSAISRRGSLADSVVARPLARKMNRHVTPTSVGSAAAVLHRERTRLAALRRGDDMRPWADGVTDPGDASFRRWLDHTEAEAEAEGLAD